MRLSILIASTPSRWDMTRTLYDNFLEKVGDKDIEVLAFFDNHKRSIGYKRQALLDIAKGKFVLWCDSDDDLLSLDHIYDATLEDVDVITFNALCRNEDGSTFVVEQRLGHPVEHNSNGRGGYADLKRPPFQNCAWRREKVKDFKFPDSSYGEDYAWLLQCYKVCTTEKHLPEILYMYNFDPAVSEAPKP